MIMGGAAVLAWARQGRERFDLLHVSTDFQIGRRADRVGRSMIGGQRRLVSPVAAREARAIIFFSRNVIRGFADRGGRRRKE